MNVGEPYVKELGCAHLMPALKCLSVDTIPVKADTVFNVDERFRLALIMLHAFTIEMKSPRTIRAFFTSVGQNLVSNCDPAICKTRYVIDAIAVVSDGDPKALGTDFRGRPIQPRVTPWVNGVSRPYCYDELFLRQKIDESLQCLHPDRKDPVCFGGVLGLLIPPECVQVWTNLFDACTLGFLMLIFSGL